MIIIEVIDGMDNTNIELDTYIESTVEQDVSVNVSTASSAEVSNNNFSNKEQCEVINYSRKYM